VSWTFLERQGEALATSAPDPADTQGLRRPLAELDAACGLEFGDGWSMRVAFVDGRSRAFATTVPTAGLAGCLADRLERLTLRSRRTAWMDVEFGSPPSARPDVEAMIPFREAAYERCTVNGWFEPGEEHVAEACLKEGRRDTGREPPILKATRVRFYNRSEGPLSWKWRDRTSALSHEYPCESGDRSSYGVNHEDFMLHLPGGTRVRVYPAVRTTFSPNPGLAGAAGGGPCRVVERSVEAGEVAVEHEARCSCQAMMHGYACQPGPAGEP
jgi:hypothetical protein